MFEALASAGKTASTFPHSLAFPTLPPTAPVVGIQVVAGVGMSYRAVSFARVMRCRAVATQGVDLTRNQLHMIRGRVNTGMISTEVVDLQFSRNGAVDLLPRPTVGENKPTLIPESSIAVKRLSSLPMPAGRRFLYLGPETGCGIHDLIVTQEQGGQLLPSFTPNNYTATCWCDLSDGEDKEEFLMRLDDLEGNLEELALAIQTQLNTLALAV